MTLKDRIRHKGKNRFTVALYYLMRAIVLAIGALFIMQGDWAAGLGCGLVFLLMMAPTVLHRRWRIYMPFSLDFVIVLFIFCTLLLGQILRFYDKVPYWDKFLHFQSGLVLSVTGFVLIYILNEHEGSTLRLNPGFIAIFAFAFAVAIGALWEICEYVADLIFHTRYWQGQTAMNTDTMNDLVADTVGALIVSVTAYFWMYRHKRLPFTPWFLRMLGKRKADEPTS